MEKQILDYFEKCTVDRAIIDDAHWNEVVLPCGYKQIFFINTPDADLIMRCIAMKDVGIESR